MRRGISREQWGSVSRRSARENGRVFVLRKAVGSFLGPFAPEYSIAPRLSQLRADGARFPNGYKPDDDLTTPIAFLEVKSESGPAGDPYMWLVRTY